MITRARYFKVVAEIEGSKISNESADKTMRAMERVVSSNANEQ